MPLHKNLSAAELLHLTRNLTRRFDQRYTQARLAELGIPLKRKAGRRAAGGGQAGALTTRKHPGSDQSLRSLGTSSIFFLG
jgi:ABC-2 type transport system ATP-binding protein